MRCFVGFVLALALAAVPWTGSAQASEQDSLSSWQAEAAGGAEEGSREANRVRNAGIGLGVSGFAFSAGLVLGGIGGFSSDCYSFTNTRKEWCDPMLVTGVVFTVGGFVGMLTSGILFAKRKRERDREEQARHETPSRVRWDPAGSQFVF